jgi:hypothetical protein
MEGINMNTQKSWSDVQNDIQNITPVLAEALNGSAQNTVSIILCQALECEHTPVAVVHALSGDPKLYARLKQLEIEQIVTLRRIVMADSTAKIMNTSNRIDIVSHPIEVKSEDDNQNIRLFTALCVSMIMAACVALGLSLTYPILLSVGALFIFPFAYLITREHGRWSYKTELMKSQVSFINHIGDEIDETCSK